MQIDQGNELRKKLVNEPRNEPVNEHRRSNRLARKGCRGLLGGFVLYFTATAACLAGDWPGILGKNRDGVAHDEKPLAAWKAELAPLWNLPLGAGYAGAVVAEGKVYVAHRQKGSDFLDCYPLRGGERIWRATFPASYSGGVDADKGPRAAPLVSEGQVFYFSATAELHCVSAKEGKTQWTRSLGKDFQLQESYFGVGTSPLALEKVVVISLGGKKGAAVVALDRANGKTVWKAVDDDVSYSSPIVATVKGSPLVIAALREKCVGLSPADGKVIFETPFGGRGPSVTAATPLVEKEKLFLTAEYQFGCAMLDLSKVDGGKKEPPVVWENQDSLTCHYTTPIFYGGHLYGVRGREDYREGDLRCVDGASGKIIWEKKELGVAHAIRVGESILLVGIDGSLRLVAASPKAYQELASGSLGAGRFRAAPALSEGLLLVRASLSPTTSELRVFDLAPAK